MAYVITSTCIKDFLCVDVCPTDCIHPKRTNRRSTRCFSCTLTRRAASIAEHATFLYVPPTQFNLPTICPDELKPFIDANAAFYSN